MKRYVCRLCAPDHCELTTWIQPDVCVVELSPVADWLEESPTESEAREEQEARAAMAQELRERDAHF